MVEDNLRRKSLLILRVAGLSRIAPHFAYFKDVKQAESTLKQTKDEKIVFNAMVGDQYG